MTFISFKNDHDGDVKANQYKYNDYFSYVLFLSLEKNKCQKNVSNNNSLLWISRNFSYSDLCKRSIET